MNHSEFESDDIINEDFKKIKVMGAGTLTRENTYSGFRSTFPGFIIWWTRLEDAAQYTVRLYIEESWTGGYDNKIVPEDTKCYEIDRIEKDRTTTYHSFIGLPMLGRRGPEKLQFKYVILIEAEGRDGKIISKSDPLKTTGYSFFGFDIPDRLKNDYSRGWSEY